MKTRLVVSIVLCGIGASACGDHPSNPVAPNPSCAFTVSVNTSAFGAAGGTATARITTGASCAWTASSNAEWASVDAAARTGDGDVTVRVAALDQPSGRSATITVAQTALALTQSGCRVALGAPEVAFGNADSSADVRVEADEGCRWAVDGAPSWASFDPASGAGAAVTRVRVARNTGPAERNATVQLGAQALTLRQSISRDPAPPSPPAPPETACAYSVSPVEAYVGSAGGSGGVDVLTAPGCAWTAGTSSAAARIVSGVSGTGPGRIAYEVERNPDTYPIDFRRIAIAVRWPTPTAGQNVWLSQFGDCGGAGRDYAITVPAAGGRYHVSVLVESAFQCRWRVEGGAPWLSDFSPPLGLVWRGDADLWFLVEPNPSTQPRTTVLFVAERRYIITQPGR